ncbi:ATP-binding protein [Streptomyces sp. NPDC005017]|uniref:ATP-binding protein n=1 Tax=Streptomyces sp. NPDC005017 TaxID=3364706 RepID=UPI0036AA5A95
MDRVSSEAARHETAAPTTGSPPVAAASFRRAPDDRLPARARHLVATSLRALDRTDALDDALLVASELVTNAIRHAPRGPVSLELFVQEASFALEVTDHSPEPPVLRPTSAPGITAITEGGRGLRLVAALAQNWGYRRNTDGTKTVWCRFACTARPPVAPPDSPRPMPGHHEEAGS